MVFEALDSVGGRCATIRFSDGHHFDAGAGWIASSFTETMGLLDSVGMRDALVQLDLRSAAYFSDEGKLHKIPASIPAAAWLSLIPARERVRGLVWLAGLFLRRARRGSDGTEVRYDDVTAEAHLASAVGRKALEVVFDTLATSLHTSLSETSAAALREMSRRLLGARFYALEEGMDSLWQRLADEVVVETGRPVRHVEVTAGGRVQLSFDAAKAKTFDGCIMAAPITRVRHVVDGIDLPPWLHELKYAPHVRLYAARRGTVSRADVHAVGPRDEAVQVSRWTGGWRWGRVPPGHSAAVVGASGELSAYLMDQPDDKVEKLLWDHAARIDPGLFALDRCHIVKVVRWAEAVPIFAPGQLTKLARWKQGLPLVFAGDWTQSACIEGAVRSAVKAARIVGRA